MQISRTNNQPNFKSKISIPHKQTLAHHVAQELKPNLHFQLNQLKQVGDDTVHFTTYFNPRREKPYALMCRVPGLDIPIVEHNIELESLSITGVALMQQAQKEAKNPIAHAIEHLKIDDWSDEMKAHVTAFFSSKHKNPVTVVCEHPKVEMPIVMDGLSPDTASLGASTVLREAKSELEKPIIHEQRILKLQEWARDISTFKRIENEA